jgi:hypothetical protein
MRAACREPPAFSLRSVFSTATLSGQLRSREANSFRGHATSRANRPLRAIGDTQQTKYHNTEPQHHETHPKHVCHSSDYPCRARPLASPGPVALLERWTSQASHLGFCSRDHGNRGREVCAARGANRYLRSGRHTVGRASDLHPGHLLPRACSGTGRKETGSQEDRALQDRALRQSQSSPRKISKKSSPRPSRECRWRSSVPK